MEKSARRHIPNNVDDDRGVLVELREQMEDELTSVFGERQIAELIEHHELGVTHQPFCESTGLTGELLLLELIGEIDEIKEPNP